MASYSTKKKVQKKKSHRKLKVALGVVIAAAGVTGATYALNVYPGRWIRDRIHPQVEDAGYQPMTATAQVMDVQQVLSTTGSLCAFPCQRPFSFEHTHGPTLIGSNRQGYHIALIGCGHHVTIHLECQSAVFRCSCFR